MNPNDQIVAEVERVHLTYIKTKANLGIQLVNGLVAYIQWESKGIVRMERKKKRRWVRPKWGLGFGAMA
jgi:hypothetical protein